MALYPQMSGRAKGRPSACELLLPDAELQFALEARRDPYLAGTPLEHPRVRDAGGVSRQDLGTALGLAVVLGEGDGQLLAMPACRCFRGLSGAAEVGVLPPGVELVVQQHDAPGRQSEEASGGRARLDVAGPDCAP